MKARVANLKRWCRQQDKTDWLLGVVIVVAVAAVFAALWYVGRSIGQAIDSTRSPEEFRQLWTGVGFAALFFFYAKLGSIADAINDVAKELKKLNERESKR